MDDLTHILADTLREVSTDIAFSGPDRAELRNSIQAALLAYDRAREQEEVDEEAVLDAHDAGNERTLYEFVPDCRCGASSRHGIDHARWCENREGE